MNDLFYLTAMTLYVTLLMKLRFRHVTSISVLWLINNSTILRWQLSNSRIISRSKNRKTVVFFTLEINMTLPGEKQMKQKCRKTIGKNIVALQQIESKILMNKLWYVKQRWRKNTCFSYVIELYEFWKNKNNIYRITVWILPIKINALW